MNMRKFWTILTVALVALAAVSCEQNPPVNGPGEQNPPVEGPVYFYAAVEDLTRTYLEAEGELFHTKWIGNETICVVAEDGTAFKFTNTFAASNKFTCSAEGAGALVGKSVEIVYTKSGEASGDVDSTAGAAGTKLATTVTFENGAEYKLDVACAFLLYSSASEVTFTAAADVFVADGQKKSTITLPAGNTIFVPVVAKACELSYSVNGEAAGSVTLTEEYNKIYDLGVLTPTSPENPNPDTPVNPSAETVYLVPNTDWTLDGAWFAAYFWDGTTDAWVKAADENSDGIYEFAVPAGMTGMLFCRMNPAFTDCAWNTETEQRVWNQTTDTTVGLAPANYFYITGWDCGEWHEAGYTVPENPNQPGMSDAVVYLVPNASWKEAGAWFAAYFWNDSSNAWAMATDNDADGIYECGVPAGMTSMLFCRMNPEFTDFGWNSETENRVWNQTADTTVGLAPANYFYITDWTAGEWHEAGYVVPENPNPGDPSTPATGDFALAGTFNGWGDLVMENNGGIHAAKGVAMDAYGEFKIKAATSWDTNFGAAAVSYMNPNNHIAVAQGGGNISITAAGTYDVYFDQAKLLVYVVTAGADYTTAPLQTVDGNAPAFEGKAIYLNTGGEALWEQGGAYFEAWAWATGSEGKWYTFTSVETGIYQTTIPTEVDNIIFVRRAPEHKSKDWNENQRWNKTADLAIPAGSNLYTITGWGDNEGTWSTK
jgi:hypothetical protein